MKKCFRTLQDNYLPWVLIIGVILFVASCNDNKKKESIKIVSKEGSTKEDTIVVCKDLGLDFTDTVRRSDELIETVNSIAKKRRPPVTTTEPTPIPVPVSTAFIYLNFRGGTISKKTWNVYIPGGADFNVSGAGLTDEQIQIILDSVRYDYRSFNVVIDTFISQYNSSTIGKRHQCYITQDYSWYGNGSGGAAFTGSFTNGSDNPSFVFSSLFSFSTKKVRECISHEVGHAIGLYHQSVFDASGILTSEYNPGCCGEAPIMGISYSQPNGRWWIGTNSYNQIQNDSLIIKSKIGLK